MMVQAKSALLRTETRWDLAFLALLASGPALAQQTSSTPAGAPTGMNVPIVQPGVAVTSVDLSLLGAYSSNVTGAAKGSDQINGLSPEDFYTSPSLTFMLARPLGLQTLFLGGDVGYTAYAKDHVLDRSRAGLNGGALGRLAFCQGSVSGLWNRAQSDLLYYLPVAGVSERALAGDVVQNISGTVTATCGRTIGLAPTFSINPYRITHSEETTLNANGISGSGGLAYQSPVIGVVSLTGQYTHVEYPDRTLPGLSTTRVTYDVAGGGISYTRRLGTRLSGIVALNYLKTRVDVSTGNQFSGLSGNADLTYILTPNIKLEGSASRLVQPSKIPLYSYEVDNKYLIDASYSLGGHFGLSAGGYHDHENYYAPLVPELGFPNSQTIDAVYAEGDYSTVRHLSFAIRVAQQHRSTDFVGFQYSATTVTLTTSAKF